MAASKLRPLTIKEVESLTATAPSCIKHHYIGGVPGLVLVHTPNNYRGYGLIYRFGGKRRKLTLGSFKALSLADARKLAGKYRNEVEAGKDPFGVKEEARSQVKARQRLDVERIWDLYYTMVASQLRTRDEKKRIFTKYILPVIQGLCVTAITKSHALKMLDPLVAQNKLRMADSVKQEGFAWCQWLIERDHIERNPFAGIRKAQANKVIRTRVLSDTELSAIWSACEAEGHWGQWFKLMILTGARNLEARAADWSEFNMEARIWTIPPERAKNKQGHRLYLTDAMLAVLNDIPRYNKTSLLFPAQGKPMNAMSGDQKVKDRIDKAMRAQLKMAGHPDPEQWQIHDFRRTIATGLQRLGFRPDIADQVIGHVGSTRTGAAAHYLHHQYDEEKKLALEEWSKHVVGCVGAVD